MALYDDPHAYRRRWSRLSPAGVARLADADPLLFVADHIALAERKDGVIAFHVELTGERQLVVLVTPGPTAPSVEECRSAVIGTIARLGEDYEDPGDDTGLPPVLALGIVVHRRGPVHVTPLDRRWSAALHAGCAYWDVESRGVLVRTESGAVIRPSMPVDA